MANTKIAFDIENFGTIKAELYPEKAPVTVENFVNLIKSDFFTGLIFHRVIAGFMIQGGGMNEQFIEKDTPSIIGEFAINGHPENDLKHTRGTLSMARTNMPNSASSQFFIMHKNAPHLDGAYAAFGRVTDEESLLVVDKIASVKTGNYGWYSDVPKETVKIEKAYIIEE